MANLNRIASVERELSSRMFLQLKGRSERLPVSQAFQSHFKLM